MNELRAQRRPCAECPWRVDVAPGQFPAERYRTLAASAYDLSHVIFACHKSTEGSDVVCAGFLARGADHNLAVRMAYSRGDLDFDVNRAGPFALHDDFRSMAIANGVAPDDPALGPCR